MARRAADHQTRRTRLPASERRESILRAAAEVFAEAGYRGGKVSDVAARVGVTEPVIFQNFGSKAGLFAAVLDRAGAEVRASLDELTAEFGSASALLSHVLSPGPHGWPDQARMHAHPGLGGRQPSTAYGVLFADATGLITEPELTEQAHVALRATAAHIADLILRAQAEGGVSDDIDPEAAAWLLLSVLSARRLRSAVIPAHLEPMVTALALRALTPPAR